MGLKFSVAREPEPQAGSGFSSVPEEIKSTGATLKTVAESVAAACGQEIRAAGYGSCIQVEQALSSRSVDWQKGMKDWATSLTALGATTYWSGVEIERNDRALSDSWSAQRELAYLRR